MLKLLIGPGLDGRDFTDVLLVLFCGLASPYLSFPHEGKMKKKMVCVALVAALGFGGYVVSAQATTDEYAPAMEELSPEMLENDGLPQDYELEIDETSQPIITDDSFPVEEGMGGGLLEEMEEAPQEMMGTSLQEEQTVF